VALFVFRTIRRFAAGTILPPALLSRKSLKAFRSAEMEDDPFFGLAGAEAGAAPSSRFAVAALAATRPLF
jgi:hypothetical protein